MEDCCAVCAEPMKWVAYGACGHREVCSTCTAMVRVVLNDSRCCICKQDCEKVFVTREQGEYTASIDDFGALPLRAQTHGYWYERSVRAYFDNEQEFRRIKAMIKLQCTICEKSSNPSMLQKGFVKTGYVFKALELLRQHISAVHKLSMCGLCLEGRKVFVTQQMLYTASDLEKHCAKGDLETGFNGHPMCEFCHKRFYGDNELYQHMSTEHYTCHFCQRDMPGQYEYFRGYDDLEAHFRNDHILCENPECLAKKFIVFKTESEFKVHNAKEHGNMLSRAERTAVLKIPVSLQVRRQDQTMTTVTWTSAFNGTTSHSEPLPPATTPVTMDESAYPPLPGTSRRRPRRRKKANGTSTATSDAVAPTGKEDAVTDGGCSASSTTSGLLSLTPDEIKAATKLLFLQIRMDLGNDEDKVLQFREIHAAFKNGALTCSEYYDRIDHLGLAGIIPKLAWLCPDQQKQQELYSVHTSRSKAGPSKEKHPQVPAAAPSKGKSKVGADTGSSSSSGSGLSSCRACSLNGNTSSACPSCGEGRPRSGNSVLKAVPQVARNPGSAPVRNAWKNNGGLRLLQQAKRESVMLAAHSRAGR